MPEAEPLVTTTRFLTINPVLGIPVVYDSELKITAHCEGRGKKKRIVVGPALLRLPPSEQMAILLHEAGHCKLFHVERRWRTLLLAPWRIARLCREQEFEADRFVRAHGAAPALVAFFRRLRPAPRTIFHPSIDERIDRLV